jgi:uncharacterized protein YjeT (DUF2065 family)
MPVEFSSLLDTLLVIAGLVLVITGLVTFIRSKTSTEASSLDAFGIKLNVTHPSLILVLAGVGLMLAPRLLPELPGRAGPAAPEVAAETQKPGMAAPAAGEAAPAPAAEVGSAGPQPTAAVPARAAPAATPARPPARPAVAAPAAAPAPAPAVSVAPPKTPVAAPPPATAAVRPPASAKTMAAAPAEPKRAPEPAATPRPADSPAPAAARPAAIPPVAAPPEAAAGPVAAARPARPVVAYAALGLPTYRSFWSGETRASYTQKIDAALQQAGRELLRAEPRGLHLDQAEFDVWWNESNQRTRSRALCHASPAPAALLSVRVEAPATISSVESAHWPELKLRLFVCATERIYRQQKTLAPQNDDAWPFATEFNSEIERFLRAYRGDLQDS